MGWVGPEVDFVQGVFPEGVLLLVDVGVYFCVEGLDSVESVRCWGLAAKLVSGLHLVFGVAAEGGVVVADGSGGDVLFADAGDYFVEVVDGEVYVVVIGDVVMFEVFFYCCCEFVPICFFEVGVGGFGGADIGSG